MGPVNASDDAALMQHSTRDLLSNGRRRRRCHHNKLGDTCPDGHNECCANDDGHTVCGIAWGKFTREMLSYDYQCCNSWNVDEYGLTWCANPTGGDCWDDRGC